ncbi:MAG: TIM-barrel domain-containing protein [Terriglobales bacterium]
MTARYNRREILKTMSAASATFLFPGALAASGPSQENSPQDFQIQLTQVQLTPVSAHTLRLTVLPITGDRAVTVPDDGSLVKQNWGGPAAIFRGNPPASPIHCGDLIVQITSHPMTFAISNSKGEVIQNLSLLPETGGFTFDLGDSPLLGLGEGGPQFDRRGSTDPMISGQGAYELETHGGRVPIPWLIGTAGWAMFIHQPFGAFDFSGPSGKFRPASPAQPLDIFFVGASDPAIIMSEYARLTGHAEMPPLWSFGYQQSHRTLASRQEVLAEAKTFREKKLPCDALIYLGTGFCPSGWNTANGSFSWNADVFPDPKEMLAEFHRDHFHAVLHTVILSRKLHGTVHDRCDLTRFDEDQVSCYWDAHRKDFAMGVDGWWPDEGDPLDIASRLLRNRMYWEGPQMDRPNERPYALHRNGYAGMQRYASFLWSGDVYSKWETLKTHIPNAINTALTGIPYWGTDIGGFVPTKEFTAELYLRWFQFGAFCPLFRCHGRTWKLRLPWGWNTGDPGPIEVRNYNGAATPDPGELHNPQVEPICRKYLELRYRMLPYLYSAVRECATTGMPIMRALWLHYPDDPVAIARGDEYLWGRSILVAPVTEQGATSRRIYLPRGSWYDFWTNERVEGGREITRDVDLETLPLYVRAGSLLPLGPVKQHVDEKVDQPLTISIYPGSDASFHLYEDDGKSFNYRKGEWMGIQITWNDAGRLLEMRLADGSHMLGPSPRPLEVKLFEKTSLVEFTGRPLKVKM